MEVGWTLRWGFFELFRNPSVEPIFVEEDITNAGTFRLHRVGRRDGGCDGGLRTEEARVSAAAGLTPWHESSPQTGYGGEKAFSVRKTPFKNTEVAQTTF